MTNVTRFFFFNDASFKSTRVHVLSRLKTRHGGFKVARRNWKGPRAGYVLPERYIINEHRAPVQLISRGDSRPEAVFLFEPPLFPCRGIATRITVRRAFLFARGRRRRSPQLRGTLSIHLSPSPSLSGTGDASKKGITKASPRHV